jgi:hypothetical protein
MMRRNVRKAVAACFGLLVALAGPLAVASSAKPKGAPKLESSLSFWPILCTAIALLGISVVAFKNANRSHLD